MTECGLRETWVKDSNMLSGLEDLGRWCISDHLLEVREMTYLYKLPLRLPAGNPGNNMSQFGKSCKWR